MTTVLDAFGVVAFLRDEPAAEAVEELLRGGDVAIVAVNLAEAVDVLARRHGFDTPHVRAVLRPVLRTRLRIRNATASLAWKAAALRARYYHHRRRPLSLPDCFLVASAQPLDSVATADPALLYLAEAEGLPVIPLAAS